MIGYGTSSVFLRALDEADIENCFSWHNDPRLYSTLGDAFRPVSKACEIDWLRRKSAYCADELNLAICLQKGGAHIGNIYLREINWVARRSALHVFIGSEEHRGKGHGYAAISQMLRIAFLDLNLNRVFLEVLADNVGAMRLYEKCGFESEGCLKKHAFKDGTYKDVLIMGITADQLKRKVEQK
jgi:RimJ/RimL family protein N-acetyltransferase